MALNDYEEPVCFKTQQNPDQPENSVYYDITGLQMAYERIPDEKAPISNGDYMCTSSQPAVPAKRTDISRATVVPVGKRKDCCSPTCSKVALSVFVVTCVFLIITNGMMYWWYTQCTHTKVNGMVTEGGARASALKQDIPTPTKDARVNDLNVQLRTETEVTVAAVTTVNADPCDSDFVDAGTVGKCYFVSEDVVTWQDAEQQCRQRSAQLITVNSLDQFNSAAQLLPDTPRVTNMAIGATCAASSEWSADYGCRKAIDGSTAAVRSVWVVSGPPAVGSWIRVDLGATSEVTQVQILNRCYHAYQNKGFKLIFSDDSQQTGQLPRASGRNRYDCGGVTWQEFDVTPRVTSYVKVEITSTYTDQYNGFREVKVIGRPVTSYWTAVKRDHGTWRSGSTDIGYFLWDSDATSVGVNGNCLSVNKRGFFPSTCDHGNNVQKRGYICTKNTRA